MDCKNILSLQKTKWPPTASNQEQIEPAVLRCDNNFLTIIWEFSARNYLKSQPKLKLDYFSEWTMVDFSSPSFNAELTQAK
jgi:hypothetical protein